jgi:hypothetical protein
MMINRRSSRICARRAHGCPVHPAQASRRSKCLRGLDPRDAAQRQQCDHGRRDQRDCGADRKRTGTDGRQDRVCVVATDSVASSTSVSSPNLAFNLVVAVQAKVELGKRSKMTRFAWSTPPTVDPHANATDRRKTTPASSAPAQLRLPAVKVMVVQRSELATIN